MPEDVAKTEAALKQWGKTYEFHTYDNAGHDFFAADRPQYRQHAAVDGRKKILRLVRDAPALSEDLAQR